MKKLIGKGTFTRAYQVGENEVLVKSSCPAKEAYALFSQGNKFAPEITMEEPGTYMMPLYPKMKAPSRQLNSDSLMVYKELRKLDGIGLDYFQFCSAVENLPFNEEIKEELRDLAGDVGNFIAPSDMRFEISPRNVTADEKGNLILLDCFFSWDALKKVA